MSELKFMLAKEYLKGSKVNPVGWYISEKFDGYRACYDPDKKQFFSRQNKPFNAPQWFIDAMPPKFIDGELWIGRNMFQEMGCVRKKVPVDEEWLNVTFQAYDLPQFQGTFKERLIELKRLVKTSKARWNTYKKKLSYPFNKLTSPLVFADQIVVSSEEHLDTYYKDILKHGGEGIMIKDPTSPYEGKRSNYLLKYKPSFDEEAIIIDYTPGQGKYKGLLGALVCRPLINHDTYSSIDMDDDHIFSISGMDDSIRTSYKSTHPINTIISYEHSGKTDKGKPRFGRYTRIRTDVIIQEHTQEPIIETIAKIVTIFKALGEHEKKNGQGFKASAYFKAIKGIYELTDFSQESILSIKGVGKSLMEKITCIIQTGTCPAYEKIKGVKDTKDVFLLISGVGPKKASELVAKGITTIDSLRKEPTLHDLLNDKQLIGLKYYEDILERIPHFEITNHEIYLKSVLHKLDPTAELTIAGSYRRKSEDSGDIDVLLKGSNQLYKQLIEQLEKEEYLFETLAKGSKKYNGMCRIKGCETFRRIDIMNTKPEEYPFAILYFTGSKEFNTDMRQHALDKGYSMNEYSLKHTSTGEPVEHVFTSEKDIFDYLDYAYVDPWKR
jgi:DNA polymerase beta